MTYTVDTKTKYEIGDSYGNGTIVAVEEKEKFYTYTVEEEDESDSME